MQQTVDGGSLTLGIWFSEVDVGWYNLVLQGQNCLYEAGDARRPFRMADIWLRLV